MNRRTRPSIEWRLRERIDALTDERDNLRARVERLEAIASETDYAHRLRLEAKLDEMRVERNDLRRQLKAETRRRESVEVVARLRQDRVTDLEKSLKRARNKAA